MRMQKLATYSYCSIHPGHPTLYLRWILLHMINLLPYLTCMTGNLPTRFITVHVYILGIGWGGLYHSPYVV